MRLAPGQRPRVDGRLEEPVWAEAPKATGFVQFEPSPGAASSERTEVAVLFDDVALYVGFRCFVREPSTLVAPLARRDEYITSDRVAVDIDSHNDGRTAFSFSVTAGGVERDALIYDDVEEDETWDAIWEGKAARFAGGYTVEMRIPFSQLRYRVGVETWGIQFQRDLPTAGETAFWSPNLPDVEGYVSLFGTLHNLDVRRAPRQIEVQPYVAGRLIQASGDEADPFYEPNATQPNAGFDAKVGLTPNLTLTATVNPDFGQVEADPAVVNLSVFETFFEERRPFFVEGTDVFSYGRTRTSNVAYQPTFFYSRRIGQEPVRFLGDVDGLGEDGYFESLDQTTIAAAGKVSGKVGSWSVGLLNAVTTEETGRFLDETGNVVGTPVEPLTNYLVGRVRRGYRDGASVVGGIFTAVNRQMGADSLFTDLLASSAYVGGLDFEHGFAARGWTVSGIVAGSMVQGDPSYLLALQRAPQRYYQRPDQDYLRFDYTGRSMLGLYSEFSLAKTGGRNWRGSLTGNVATPGFEVNDLGFQNRADAASVTWQLDYNQPEPRWLNYYSIYTYGGVSTNFGGDIIDHDYRGGFFLRFRNLWSWSTTGGISPTYTNDRLTRGGPLARRPAYGSLSTVVSTDRSRRLSAQLQVSLLRDLPHSFAGTIPEWDRFVTIGLTARPSNALEVSLEPTWGIEVDTDQFFTRIRDDAARATFGTRYVFADLRQEQVDLGVRLNWTFTPELTLQLYARPFILSGQYSRFKQFRTPGSFDFDVYGEEVGAVSPEVRSDEDLDGNGLLDDYALAAEGQRPDRFVIDPRDGGEPFSFAYPDFNFRSLRGNAVLRWEWRPGSTLFLVWQQQRTDVARYDGFGVFEELGEVFRAPVENVFLVKLTYWLGV